MTGSGRHLHDADVDFLMDRTTTGHSTANPQDGATRISVSAAREVTMRGDLEKINLSDIFQTLAMSKMEGLLRVVAPIEQRDIHFENGYVRCLVPKRVETLRLGQRLIRAGLISSDQLRSALLEQKRSKRAIGETLVASGLVSNEDIEDVVANQVQEDLFGLFTWLQGTFEFYRGKIEDPVVAAQIDAAPSFDVNGVLLEVARRSDEWQMIIQAVRSLDEIFVQSEDADVTGATNAERAVLEACERRFTLRELADVTLLGVFECSRTVRALLNRGVLRKVTIDEGFEAAEQLIGTGETKRAAMTVHAILERGEDRSREASVRAAELLAKAGDARGAGRTLIDAARLEPDPGTQLDLARRARELSPRSLEVLVYLHGVSHRAPDVDRKERLAVTSDLVDELFDHGDFDDALGLIEQLEIDSADLGTCRPRRARILARLGRNDEAVEALIGLAEQIENSKDKDRLSTIYEQILKIDYRRKDIARALKNLHASQLARRTRLGVLAALVGAMGLIGWVQFDAWSVSGRLDRLATEVTGLLDQGETNRAVALVQQIQLELGERPELAVLQSEVDAARKRAKDEHQRADEIRREALLRTAVEQIEAGEVQTGLDTFFSRAGLGSRVDKLEEDMKDRLEAIRRSFETLARTLAEKLPPEPTLLQKPAEEEAQLARLRTDFSIPQRRLVAGLLVVRDDARIVNSLGRDHEAFFATMTRLQAVFDLADQRERAYTERVSRRRIAEELTPVYEDAVRFENAHDFEAALAAYRTLAEKHPGEDGLREHFRDRVERLSTILGLLGTLRATTEEGDFPTAQARLRALRQQYPEIPFDVLVALPVLVRTTPGGAKVFVDDRYVGDSPLTTSYRPGATTVVRIERDGYFTEQTELAGDSVGLIRSLLVRQPDWILTLDGTVDREMVATADGHALVIDRAGGIRCLRSTDGKEIWQIATGDLSGLLSRPVLWGDRALVTSIDGSLRCLSVKDGATLWEEPGLAASAAPAVGRKDDRTIVVIGTLNGTVAGYDLDDGHRLWQMTPGVPFESDLLAIHGVVFAASSKRLAFGFDIATGAERWRTDIPRGVTLPLAIDGSRVVLVGDDGSVCALDGLSGDLRWREDGLNGVTAAPTIAGGRVYLGDGRDLLVFDLRTGVRQNSRRFQAELRARLSSAGDLVYVGDDRGVIHAVSQDALEDRFLLRGAAMAIAPVLVLPDGTTLIAFQDQSVHGFVGPR